MAVAAIGLAASIYGSYLQKRAGDKAAAAQQQYMDRVFDYANTLRKDSMAALSDRKVYGASEWLFPGLLAQPQTFTNAHGEQRSVFGGGAGVDKGSVAANPWGYMNRGPVGPSTLQTSHTGRSIQPQTPTPPTSGGAHAGVDPATFDPSRASTDSPMGTHMSQPPMAPPTGGAVPMPGMPQPGPVALNGGLNSGPLHAGVDPAQFDQGASTDSVGFNTGAMRNAVLPTGGAIMDPTLFLKKTEKKGRRHKTAQPDAGTSQTISTGVQGGSTDPNDFAGALITKRMMEFLKNPGQLSSITYERAQEQANQGFNMASQDAMARIMGVGVDPRSGIGQVTQENNVLNLAKARNEAARDYSLAQDQMKRADIGLGTEMYQNALKTVFGLQGARAEAATAGGVPNPGAPTAAGAGTAAMGSAVSGIGNALSGMSNSTASTPQAQTTGMNGQPVQGTITYLPGQGK